MPDESRGTDTIDHVADVDTLISTEWKDSTTLVNYIKAYVKQVQDIEDVFQDIKNLRRYENAKNAQLDVIGDIVGQPRTLLNADTSPFFGFENQTNAQTLGDRNDPTLGGLFRAPNQRVAGNVQLSNDEYKRFIDARVFRNITSVQINEISEVIKLILGVPITTQDLIKVLPQWDGTVPALEWDGTTAGQYMSMMTPEDDTGYFSLALSEYLEIEVGKMEWNASTDQTLLTLKRSSAVPAGQILIGSNNVYVSGGVFIDSMTFPIPATAQNADFTGQLKICILRPDQDTMAIIFNDDINNPVVQTTSGIARIAPIYFNQFLNDEENPNLGGVRGSLSRFAVGRCSGDTVKLEQLFEYRMVSPGNWKSTKIQSINNSNPNYMEVGGMTDASWVFGSNELPEYTVIVNKSLSTREKGFIRSGGVVPKPSGYGVTYEDINGLF